MEINGGCPAKVIFEPVNGTAWLHRAELAALFGVTAQTVNACMDALFKENLADRQEACKYDLYVSGNRIRHDVREVRLDAVIAMAFRIGSPQAKILREWFIDRCLNYGLCGILPVDMENFRMN
jgi:hypothetical protein